MIGQLEDPAIMIGKLNWCSMICQMLPTSFLLRSSYIKFYFLTIPVHKHILLFSILYLLRHIIKYDLAGLVELLDELVCVNSTCEGLTLWISTMSYSIHFFNDLASSFHMLSNMQLKSFPVLWLSWWMDDAKGSEADV